MVEPAGMFPAATGESTTGFEFETDDGEAGFHEEQSDARDVGRCTEVDGLGGVVAHLNAASARLQDLLPDTATTEDAAVLLRQFRFVTERATDALLERDPVETCSELGVSFCGARDGMRRPTFDEAPCVVCFERAAVPYLPCGHTCMCGACLKEYLESELDERLIGITELTCPEPKCMERLRPSIVKEFASKEVYDKFMEYYGRSAIDRRLGLHWCPQAGCETIVNVSLASSFVCPSADCEKPFCPTCNSDAHDPMPCYIVETWTAREQDESQNAKWVLANTMPCPKCHVPIERSAGCDHMTCRKPVGCGGEFCYRCGAPYHGHSCKGPQERSSLDRTMAKDELQLYAHASELFAQYEKQQRQWASPSGSARQEMLKLALDIASTTTFSTAWAEFHKCCQHLERWYQFLKWAAALHWVEFATKKNKTEAQKGLFDVLTTQLRANCEQLTSIMKNTKWREIGPLELHDQQQKLMQNKAQFEKFFDGLASHIHELL